MISQRFNLPQEWKDDPHNYNVNYMYIGFNVMLHKVSQILVTGKDQDLKMIEIGCHMGESTMMIASTDIFKTIYAIDPYKGEEKFNKIEGHSWEDIKKEFFINTRHFDNIKLIEDYSYNVVDNFEDKSIDFIYIDGEHDYESVKKDIELYLPKLKDSGIIGGHDFSTQWPGVRRAVNETLGIPNHVYGDHSWLKYKNKLL